MYSLTALKFLDAQIFLAINNLPHPYVLDQVFLFFSFYPLVIWLTIGVAVILYEERVDKLFIVRLIVALIASGFIASALIKPIVRRPRPDISHGEQVVIVDEKPAAIPWNNDFAFPSGHAAVAFAGAYIVAKEEAGRKSKSRRKLSPLLFYGLVSLTAFSRIYLGKHYPMDILAGGILGLGIGWVVWRFIDHFRPARVY